MGKAMPFKTAKDWVVQELEKLVELQESNEQLKADLAKLREILWELEQNGHPCECLHCESFWDRYREDSRRGSDGPR